MPRDEAASGNTLRDASMACLVQLHCGIGAADERRQRAGHVMKDAER
jgi:hypothetical protein